MNRQINGQKDISYKYIDLDRQIYYINIQINRQRNGQIDRQTVPVILEDGTSATFPGHPANGLELLILIPSHPDRQTDGYINIR